MINIKVRACIKCRLYVVIHTTNVKNQQELRLFDKIHSNHYIVTIDKSELDETYKRDDVLNAEK
jgi:hypothetical protein